MSLDIFIHRLVKELQCLIRQLKFGHDFVDITCRCRILCTFYLTILLIACGVLTTSLYGSIFGICCEATICRTRSWLRSFFLSLLASKLQGGLLCKNRRWRCCPVICCWCLCSCCHGQCRCFYPSLCWFLRRWLCWQCCNDPLVGRFLVIVFVLTVEKITFSQIDRWSWLLNTKCSI